MNKINSRTSDDSELDPATKKCSACAEEILEDAKVCKYCGKVQQPKMGCASIFLVMFVVVFIIIAFANRGSSSTPTAPSISTPDSTTSTPQTSEASTTVTDLERSAYQQVSDQAVKQYNIAKAQGDKMQICVQAGFVVAAYLQQEDAPDYDQWKATQKADCTAAGVPQS